MVVTVKSMEARSVYPQKFVGRITGRYPAGILLINSHNIKLWVNLIDIRIGAVSVTPHQ